MHGRHERCDDSNADVLQLDGPDAASGDYTGADQDEFFAQMSVPSVPIRADRAMLRSLSQSEVLVRRLPNPALPAQYFRTMDPLADIIIGSCGHFFEADEYEMLRLEEGRRPFSRDRVNIT
jgi:intraflagellar transport protein 122